MKNSLLLFTFLLGSLLLAPCEAGIHADSDLPRNKKCLRMLCIGNSFSLDGTAYLGEVMVDAGIPTDSFGIYCAVKASASLEYWWQQYENDEVITDYLFMGGSKRTPTDLVPTLKNLLHEPWDVIVLQQCVALSDQQETFEPYLSNLVQAIRRESANKEVAIVWQMVWSRGETSAGGPHGEAGWAKIAEASRSACEQAGITTIIPTGTTIQNARLVPELNQADSITRDGTHLLFGIGRYLAALTWYEAVCHPIFGIPLPSPSSRVRQIDSKLTPFVAITDENYPICQRCVLNAIANPFDLTDVEGNVVSGTTGALPIDAATDASVYLLNGTRVSQPPTRGIYLQGGRKYLRKQGR